MCSIIVDKELKSLIPRHLIERTREEAEYELDFLMNNLPIGEGLLIGECPRLRQGKKYSKDDKIIKGISVRSASSINDFAVKYSSNKKVTMDDGSIVQLIGIIFNNERIVIAPIYISIKSISDRLFFVLNKKGLVGMRNSADELLEPQFDLITNPQNNIAIGFKIAYIDEEEIYQCQCCLLKFSKDTVCLEDIGEMTGSQLYELLYKDGSYWENFILNEEHKILITQYWKHIFDSYNTFWYSYCQDFKYLWEDEHYCDEIEETKENFYNDVDDSYNWEYYNDNLDMDQQDKRFWNF